jgi:hypothetical protein
MRQPLDLGVEIDRRHDSVAELLFDQRLPRRSIHHHQFVETIEQWVGGRHRCSSNRNFVQHSLFFLAQTKECSRLLGQGLDEFHLAEQGTDDQDRRHAADLIGDVSPAPALLAFDIENLLGQLFPAHGRDLDF